MLTGTFLIGSAVRLVIATLLGTLTIATLTRLIATLRTLAIATLTRLITAFAYSSFSSAIMTVYSYVEWGGGFRKSSRMPL